MHRSEIFRCGGHVRMSHQAMSTRGSSDRRGRGGAVSQILRRKFNAAPECFSLARFERLFLIGVGVLFQIFFHRRHALNPLKHSLELIAPIAGHKL